VGVSEKSVRTTLANFKNFGSPIESPRSGRPKATTPRDEKWICRQARINPQISYRYLAAEYNLWSGEHTVSKDTVRKILLYQFIYRHSKTAFINQGSFKKAKVV
jgi:hypothetical protein